MTISYKELVSKFVHGKVTNKDIIREVDYNRCLGNIDIAIDCMELARADEREKIIFKLANLADNLDGVSFVCCNNFQQVITKDDALKCLKIYATEIHNGK